MSDHTCENCGSSFDSQEGLAGHKATCTNEPPEKAMSTDEPTDTTDELTVSPLYGNVWRVTNTENATAYKVQLNDPENGCTCPDHTFRNGDPTDNEVCKHFLAANEAASSMSWDVHMAGNITSLAKSLHEMEYELREAVQTLNMHLGTGAMDVRVGAENDTVHSQDDRQASTPDREGTEDAEVAAEALQSAFDDHLTDMQVTAHNQKVWFQTGKETEDSWPYPGGDSVFDVITDPDVVSYVHDGTPEWADDPHPWFADKPGEWWKNAIEPGDVEKYISEVLE